MKTPNSIAQLPFISPVTVAMLSRIGIATVDELRMVGVVEVYLNLKRAGGTVSLSLLWAFEAAATGRVPAEVCGARRAQLLTAFAHASHRPLPIHGPHIQRPESGIGQGLQFHAREASPDLPSCWSTP